MHTCRLGGRVRKAINPFTQDPVENPIDDGLTVAERTAVATVFAESGVRGPEADFEGYALYLAAGGSVRFRFCDIEQDERPLTSFGVEIVVPELSGDVLSLVLEVARQGNLAFMSSTGDRVGLCEKPSDPRVERRWPGAILIHTNDVLRLWLEQQIGGRELRVPGQS